MIRRILAIMLDLCGVIGLKVYLRIIQSTHELTDKLAADFLRDQGIMGPQDTMYVEIPVVLTPHEDEVQEGEPSEIEDKAAPGWKVAQQRTPQSSPHSSRSDTSVPIPSFTFIEYNPTDEKGKKSLSRVGHCGSFYATIYLHRLQDSV